MNARERPGDPHTREEEAVRGYIRRRGDLVDDLTRTKRRIQKFLVRYEIERYRTGMHLKWMGGLWKRKASNNT
jgi:hypothetical protein